MTPRKHWIPDTTELMTPSFVAMDFETANRSQVSACQIALARYDDGVLTDRLVTYLKPPAGHNEFIFTYLHGIGADDVSDAPAWPDVVDDVSRFIADAPVYAHNAPFDSAVWAALDEFFGSVSLPPRFYCSYRTARRQLPGLVNYKLPTVVHACDPAFELNHHDACSDAEACGVIVAKLQELVGNAEGHGHSHT